MFAAMAFGAGKSFLGFLGRRAEAKRQAGWDRYHNGMAKIQAAQATNTLVQNSIIQQEQHAANKMTIEMSRIMAAAKVKAGAAAAGVAGGSVNDTTFDLSRSAAVRQKENDDRLEMGLRILEDQREKIHFQAAMAQKPITRTPSIAEGLLGTAVGAATDYVGNMISGSSGTSLEGADSTMLPDVSEILPF